MVKTILFLCFVALVICSHVAFAFDSAPLQDICVADFKSSARTNGLACKKPESVKAKDFFFRVGLVHFQHNVGHGNAVAIGAWNTQYPGLITTASNVFKSNPPIADEVLAKAFQVDQSIVDFIKSKV
ncbi:hypothetical protein RJ639_025117 [Escallonia herrerae]|uniref:Cupin type-1 domain-containing protein n=1 Tax=Escallonia herrerae TaxID=1293975 RepID=A0AA88UX40_9ASTE|nr:hypothetical protein RJ639_025117 [Escallonia herrerae]